MIEYQNDKSPIGEDHRPTRICFDAVDLPRRGIISITPGAAGGKG